MPEKKLKVGDIWKVTAAGELKDGDSATATVASEETEHPAAVRVTTEGDKHTLYYALSQPGTYTATVRLGGKTHEFVAVVAPPKA